MNATTAATISATTSAIATDTANATTTTSQGIFSGHVPLFPIKLSLILVFVETTFPVPSALNDVDVVATMTPRTTSPSTPTNIDDFFLYFNLKIFY